MTGQGSPRVDQARRIVAKRRSDSRSRGGRAAAPSIPNDYASLNPFQCLDATGASAPAMVRGSYSPPKSRGRSGSPRGRSRSSRDSGRDSGRDGRDGSRGGVGEPPAVQYADSNISEATPVHANNLLNQYQNAHHSAAYDQYKSDGVEVEYAHARAAGDPPPDGGGGVGHDVDNDNGGVMHDLLPNHSLMDDSSTFADETTTAMSPGSPPRSNGRTGSTSNGNNSGSGTNSGSGNSGSGTNSGNSKEAYTRIMHQYLVQSQTNPLTKRAAASVIVEAATAAEVNTGTAKTTTRTTTTTRATMTTTNTRTNTKGSPPRPSPLPPLDPSSSQNPTNSRLRSLLSSGITSKENKDGAGDDATTEDMTNSYPISNDGASTISSLSSGSGRRAAYRSLVHFLPSLLPMPPPSPQQSQPSQPQQPQPQQQEPPAGESSLHDLNVSGISYHGSVQTGGTGAARMDGISDVPTPVRSGSRSRDDYTGNQVVGVDPDGPILGRRATVWGGDEEDNHNHHGRYDDSDDSETLGSLVTAEADSAAAGFYPVGPMQQQPPQQRQMQRQGHVQNRGDDSIGTNENVARDVLSKYGQQGKSSGNISAKPMDQAASSDPPVDTPSPPRPSPNGTRHSANLRMKARSRSPANRRSHPQQSFPVASKSEPPLARSGQNQGNSDPMPTNPSSSAANTPSDRGVSGKQGGIAARIAMFEKNSASTPPPSASPKPRAATKRWTPPPNDIPNPSRVQPMAPSSTSKQETASSIGPDDESVAGASVASRASSIPFDEQVDRGMRAAASTLTTAAPIPEQKELAHDDDEWRERIIMGQLQVAPRENGTPDGGSNLLRPLDESRSVSPRKPNWQRADTSSPEDKVETNKQAVQPRGAGAARLARHRQRSQSPQKAEIRAQAEDPRSDTRSNEEQSSRAPTPTKSIFSPPVSGNRVRWSTSFEDASDEGIADDTDEVMMREIDEAMMAHQRSSPRDMDQNSNQIHKGEQSPGTGNSRSRAHAALQSRRKNQDRQNQEVQQALPVVSSSTVPLHHVPAARVFPDAPEDEEDELGLAESFPPEPSGSGGRLGIETTNYGRGEEIDHTANSDFDNDNGADAFLETMHSDTFDVDVHPQNFGSEDDDDDNGIDDMPEANANATAESRQLSPNFSSSSRFLISINDLELLGARELLLSSASTIEPNVNCEGLVSTAFRDAVRAEEARLLRQRCVDFVSFRRESGHDPMHPLIHLDDVLADVVIIQEIALDKLELGDYDGAMSSFMSIVTKCEDGTYTFADERVQDELTGTIMHNIAVIHMQLGIFDITPQLWDEACMTRRDSNPELGIFQHSVATSLNEMGVSLFACGNFEKAIQAFADTIYVRQEIHGMDNAPLAQAINNIGVVHFAMGSIDQSLEAFDEALQIYRLAMLAENEGNVSNDESDIADGSGAQTLLLGIATALSNVAYARATQGEYAEAGEALGEAIEIQEAVLDSNNPRIEKSLALYTLLEKIANFEDVAGRSSSIAPQALSAAFDPFDSMEV